MGSNVGQNRGLDIALGPQDKSFKKSKAQFNFIPSVFVKTVLSLKLYYVSDMWIKNKLWLYLVAPTV